MAENEWSLQIDVSGEQFFKPGTFDRLPDGCFECVVKKSWREASASKNEDGSAKPDNLVFELEVQKGAEKGKVVRKYKSVTIGDPGSVPRKEWKNLLATVAKDPAALEKGAITIKAALFAGKTVFIHVANPPEGTKTTQGKTAYANINFITKDMVAELGAKNGAAKGSNGTAKGAGTFAVETGGAPQPGGEAVSLE